VLLNLLGNASKFTDYGFVSLSVSVRLRENGIEHVVIEVADTGIGIAQEDQGRLFAPFVQARSLGVARPPGTGLGLVICKRLIESMGGTVALASELGRGTTIMIELPLRIDPAMRAPRGDAAAADRTPALAGEETAAALQILIVEDQEINREVLKRQLLTLRIAECQTAVDGAQALRLVERQPYAMVITDCMMPGMDGVTLIRHIRELERRFGRRRAALIALTANAMPQQRDACFAAGADDVFVKPVAVDVLAAMLERHGIVAPPIVELEKAGIPSDRHTDLWEKLHRTLVSELSALLALSLDEDAARAKEIVHRIVGTASWFHLQTVAQAATRLEGCLENGEPPHEALFELRTAISRATAEVADSAAGAPS
jgi:CheY-like chemotaxis protein